MVFAPLAPAAGQINLPYEMPDAVHIETNSALAAIAVTPPALPEAPVAQHKVIDKKFIAAMAALGGAESLRFTVHKLVLDHEHAAGAPWVPTVPSNPHLVTRYGGIYAAELLTAYELKKPHSWLPGDKFIRKFWWAYPAAMGAAHIKNGVRGIRTQPPSGCPAALCGSQ
jgi:hypothetical protein